MSPNTKKVWNEDLLKALDARHQQAWQQKQRAQHKWRDGARTIEAVRKDIWLTSTGKIYNLPLQDATKFTKTVYEECVRIIKGEAPIYPPGFAPLTPTERRNMVEKTFLPYVEKMQRESGAYAILLAFHFSQRESMSKDEICRIGQPYCKDEMLENYHAGRMYGAWKSIDTLARHELVTVHKAGARWTERGFRSNGKNTYSITADGKRAIQQMLQKWPDIGQRTTPNGPWQDNGGLEGDLISTIFNTPDYSAATRVATVSSLSAAGSLGMHGVAPRGTLYVRNVQSRDDGDDLREWIESAVVGAQKTFKAGKERRRYLHKLCDLLMHQHPGLVLEHQSDSVGQRRHLYITLRSKPNNFMFSSPAGSSVRASGSTKKRPTPASCGSGQTLGTADGQTAKKPKSANQAAAQAALARLEKSCATTRKKAHAPNFIDLVGSNDRLSNHPIVDLRRVAGEEEDSKPPAAKRKRRNVFDYQPGDYCKMRDSEKDPFHIIRVHTNGYVTVRDFNLVEQKLNVREILPCIFNDAQSEYINDATGATKVQQDSSLAPQAMKSEVIDLIGHCAKGAQSIPVKSEIQSDSALCILIDDRERSRNHKPRELRIELGKELNSGAVQAIWPKWLALATVEERKLPMGDFAFETINFDATSTRLSVVVERKRVADLVQRSAYGDHWKQLSRMRDCCSHAILLIENDIKLAERFDAYGSQFLVHSKPSHYTIENDAGLFLFIGRAILSSERISFVQTQDTRGTYRAVGAIGLVAQTSNKNVVANALENPPTAARSQQEVSDLLTSGGIHWKLAKELAFQFGSLQGLQWAFDSCSSQAAKKLLMVPMLRNMGVTQEDCPGNLEKWSEAIHHVVSATPETRTANRRSFSDIQRMVGNNVCDPGTLLCFLYTEDSPDAALNASMDFQPDSSGNFRRRVHVKLSKGLEAVFERPGNQSFYTLEVEDDNPWALPMVTLSTTCSNLYSDGIVIHVLQGDQLMGEIAAVMVDDSFQEDFVSAAHEVAEKINDSCTGTMTGQCRYILIVQGLESALSKAAQMPSFRVETRVLCDTVLMVATIHHNIVVLKATRNKLEETAMIVRQLALACYYYQLLPYERD